MCRFGSWAEKAESGFFPSEGITVLVFSLPAGKYTFLKGAVSENSAKLGNYKMPVQPNSLSKLTLAACNFKNNAQETYFLVSDL